MSNLYIHTEEVHNMTAPREVVPIVMDLVKPSSVLDVGCGIGTWLKAFEEKGIDDYLGIDGDYVSIALFQIPSNKFQTADLRKRWELKRKFDLVVSLEVAEHLPESSADLFVESLVNHGSNILFSASIPGQEGQNHLNEQWPDYWQKKFSVHGYYFHDVVRPKIWNNSDVEWWYKQNIFLVTKEQNNECILNVVHPESHAEKIKRLQSQLEDVYSGEIGVKLSFGILGKALRKYVSIRKK